MRILSIETSCDETAIAILEISGSIEKPEIRVLGNTLLSQVHLHAEFGGVYPTLAKREHQKNLPILLEKTLKEAGMNQDSPDIDYISVTVGPGLEPALWTGIVFAEELRERWQKPIIPVNHMEGHIYSVLYQNSSEVETPALALLISGGHTELIQVKTFGEYKIMGHTLDDAVGEAFDKVARMLSLPYPGGPRISALAKEAREKSETPEFKFPRPMLHSQDLNFSFSGLKTAVLYKIRDEARDDEEFKREIARAFEDAAIEVLIEKTREALERMPETKTLIVAGGVSANTYLREKVNSLLLSSPNLNILFPAKELTTDNAIMIALAAFVRVSLNPEVASLEEKLKASGNLSISSQSSQE